MRSCLVWLFICLTSGFLRAWLKRMPFRENVLPDTKALPMRVIACIFLNLLLPMPRRWFMLNSHNCLNYVCVYKFSRKTFSSLIAQVKPDTLSGYIIGKTHASSSLVASGSWVLVTSQEKESLRLAQKEIKKALFLWSYIPGIPKSHFP